jgi:HK97 family phage major capsid protein/HK97 family phage prohead protease
MLNRAYSLLDIKAVNDEQRTFEGIASTPTPDRDEDIMEPDGAQYKLPIPLLWQHGRAGNKDPVGWVTEVTVKPEGLFVKGKFHKVDSPPSLRDDLERSWTLVRDKLVRGLSIGFNPIEWTDIKGSYGRRYVKWDWLELSPVSIPANADASITSIKSADQALRAASGHTQGAVVRLTKTPGASGKSLNLKGIAEMKTVAEQITGLEAKRASNAARMAEIMQKGVDEGRSTDDAEAEEFDTLKAETVRIDSDIVRLKSLEDIQIKTAKPLTPAVNLDAKAAAEARTPNSGIITVKANVEKGIAFTRYVKALAMAKGNLNGALSIAENNKGWNDTTPEVTLVLKAAVAAGDTTSVGWASELVYNQNLVADFIEFLRPQTILGKMMGLTRVPFNVRMSGQDSGSTAYWVGQGKPVPVSKLHTMEVTLGIAKAAGMVILTEELVRSSAPSAETLVRNDLTAAIAAFLDVQFISPDYAASANVSPASITNGVTPTAATGTTSATLRADVQTLFGIWIAANLNPQGGVWIMTPGTALAISLMLNALGQPVFPTITMNGGTFFGLPVIVSNAAKQVGSPVAGEGNLIVLANAPEILLADDGQVTIDASREASLEMLDNPTNATVGPTATSMVSMFQTNSVAIRAVRFINWKKRRVEAVAYIKDAAYVT